MNRKEFIGTGALAAICAGCGLIAYFAACLLLRIRTLRTFAAEILRRR